MGLLDRWLGVPGERPGAGVTGLVSGGRGLGRVVGLSSFDQGPMVKIDGIPRPVSAPVANESTFRILQIPQGKRGTDETLQAMAELAIEASQDPYFIEFIRAIVRDCPARDEECILATLLRWTVDNIKYVYDPKFLEYVRSPGWLAFVSGEGDCDCGAVFVVAALLALGLSGGFKAVAVDLEMADEFSHVFPWGTIKGRRVALDWVMRPARLGQEPPEREYLMPANVLQVA